MFELTTEQALRRAILAAPADDTPKRALADYLIETEGFVKCPLCRGTGQVWWATPEGSGFRKGGMTKCTMNGCHDGWVTDGRKERGEFILAQLALEEFGPEPHCHCGDREAEGRAPKHYDCPWTHWYADTKALKEAEKRLRHFVLPGLDEEWGYSSACVSFWDEVRDPRHLTAVIRRGFVSEVYCLQMKDWIGNPCEYCNLMPRFGPVAISEPCAQVGCLNGYVGGIGRSVVERNPITHVRILDRRPHTDGHDNQWWWVCESRYAIANVINSTLPLPVWVKLASGPDGRRTANTFPSPDDAFAALSDVLIEFVKRPDS